MLFFNKLSPELAEKRLAAITEPMVQLGQAVIAADAEKPWDAVVSEGTSGQIPGLVIKSILDTARSRRGSTIPVLLHAMHDQHGRYLEIANRFRDNGIDPDDRVLLVTEVIKSGYTVTTFNRAAEVAGVRSMDFATVASYPSNRYSRKFRRILDDGNHQLLVGSLQRKEVETALYGCTTRLLGTELRPTTDVWMESVVAPFRQPNL